MTLALVSASLWNMREIGASIGQTCAEEVHQAFVDLKRADAITATGYAMRVSRLFAPGFSLVC
jgi:hypothetical protein